MPADIDRHDIDAQGVLPNGMHYRRHRSGNLRYGRPWVWPAIWVEREDGRPDASLRVVLTELLPLGRPQRRVLADPAPELVRLLGTDHPDTLFDVLLDLYRETWDIPI